MQQDSGHVLPVCGGKGIFSLRQFAGAAVSEPGTLRSKTTLLGRRSLVLPWEGEETFSCSGRKMSLAHTSIGASGESYLFNQFLCYLFYF